MDSGVGSAPVAALQPEDSGGLNQSARSSHTCVRNIKARVHIPSGLLLRKLSLRMGAERPCRSPSQPLLFTFMLSALDHLVTWKGGAR